MASKQQLNQILPAANLLQGQRPFATAASQSEGLKQNQTKTTPRKIKVPFFLSPSGSISSFFNPVGLLFPFPPQRHTTWTLQQAK